MNRIPIPEGSLPRVAASLSEAVLTRVLDGSGHEGEGFRAGWISGLSNTRLFVRHPRTGVPQINLLNIFPAVRDAVNVLQVDQGYRTLTQVMVNLLEPGGKLSAHRDGPPDDDRWHLPVETNKAAVWWDEVTAQTIHMEAGYWHGPVYYCGVLHAVANNGDTPRLHIVADFEKRPFWRGKMVRPTV